MVPFEYIVPLCTCTVWSEDFNAKHSVQSHCVPSVKLVKMYAKVLYSDSCSDLPLLVECQKNFVSKDRKTESDKSLSVWESKKKCLNNEKMP